MASPLRSILAVAGLGLLLSSPLAGAGNLLPEIPKAKARVSATQGCVEPTEVMRHNHMKFLLHHRKEALREGVRTKKYSLMECINCHVPDPDSPQAVHYGNPKHFCSSCHTYAAVRIDCFECHRDTPLPSSRKSTSASGVTAPVTLASGVDAHALKKASSPAEEN
ncbi:MAG: hypothetical protein D6721_09260 [Gammaproteobacteria bacterium]|nr:MAG: hypothetical protein D6721_09260 [Gammaproteobacteria bacterium]